jgi:hypothetical protein
MMGLARPLVELRDDGREGERVVEAKGDDR